MVEGTIEEHGVILEDQLVVYLQQSKCFFFFFFVSKSQTYHTMREQNTLMCDVRFHFITEDIS